jgi:putative phosphoribosyl transferase
MTSRLGHRQYWLDRAAAGEELAAQLSACLSLQGLRDKSAIVVALPRGGVAVAAVIAQKLGLPLTTWAVRKLTLPSNPEFAIGAIAGGDVVLWDPEIFDHLEKYPELRGQILESERRELLRRKRLFGDAAPDALSKRDIIVVDDGIATGLTVKAALLSLRQLSPSRLILAVPVVAAAALPGIRQLVDDAIVLSSVDNLIAVGCYYSSFAQLGDEDVLTLLSSANKPWRLGG